MGDLIEVMDTVSVNIQRRMFDGDKPDQFELCIIYPEVLQKDNVIKKYLYQTNAYSDLGEVVRKIETVFI